jgi:hypothetical protein
MDKRKVKDFVGPRQRARRIRLAINRGLNEYYDEVTNNDQEIGRNNVQPLNPFVAHCLENVDAQIADIEVQDNEDRNSDTEAEHYSDSEVLDDSLSPELDGSSSSENDTIASDLSDFEDLFDFSLDDFQLDESDVDVDSVDGDGQDRNWDWDYYEENDEISEKQRQVLFLIGP